MHRHVLVQMDEIAAIDHGRTNVQTAADNRVRQDRGIHDQGALTNAAIPLKTRASTDHSSRLHPRIAANVHGSYQPDALVNPRAFVNPYPRFDLST